MVLTTEPSLQLHPAFICNRLLRQVKQTLVIPYLNSLWSIKECLLGFQSQKLKDAADNKMRKTKMGITQGGKEGE